MIYEYAILRRIERDGEITWRADAQTGRPIITEESTWRTLARMGANGWRLVAATAISSAVVEYIFEMQVIQGDEPAQEMPRPRRGGRRG